MSKNNGSKAKKQRRAPVWVACVSPPYSWSIMIFCYHSMFLFPPFCRIKVTVFWRVLLKRNLQRCGDLWTRDLLLDGYVWLAAEANYNNFVVKCSSLMLCSFGQFIFGYQGVLAQRRSNFQGNQFPLATDFARKAAVAPLGNRAFSHNRMANWKARYYCLIVILLFCDI